MLKLVVGRKLMTPDSRIRTFLDSSSLVPNYDREQTNEHIMKIRVYILIRSQTLNPADETIKMALHQMGYTNVSSLKLGRFFEFVVDDSHSESEWRKCIGEALKKPVAGFPNPITEELRMEIVR